MDIRTFTLHDVSQFPLVRFTGDAPAGYAARWCDEMDRLVGDDRSFVLIFPQGDRQEAHEDRVARGAWLKRNRQALAEKCLSVIVVEPDAERRTQLEAMFPNLVRAFGAPQAARASEAGAISLGRHLLAGGSLADAPRDTDASGAPSGL